MSNIWNNIAMITEPTHKALYNKLILAKTVDRRYDKKFANAGAQIGDTISVRYPGIGASAVDGLVASPGAVSDTYKQVQLVPRNASVFINATEMNLNIDDFEKQVIQPISIQMASKLDSLISDLFPAVPLATGVPGTAVSTLEAFNYAKSLLELQGCVDEEEGMIKVALHPITRVKLIAGMAGLLNPTTDISDQYKKGTIGIAGGMAFSSTAKMPVHTVGTFGTSTPLMNATASEGVGTLVIKGMASGTSSLNIGDTLTVDGTYGLNPVTKESTGELMTFVITAPASDVSGTITVSVLPAPKAGVNVTALPQSNAVVKIWGTNNNASSAKVGKVNLVYHRDAFVLAAADLVPYQGIQSKRFRDAELGIPFLLSFFPDGRNGGTLVRLDAMAGACIGRDFWASKVLA